MQSPPETVANIATNDNSEGTVGRFVAFFPARMLAVARVTAMTAGYPPTQHCVPTVQGLQPGRLPGF